MSFIDKNGMTPSLQSAYKSHHSMVSALRRIHKDLVLCGCDGKSCLLVLLDLSVAFDTTNHTNLPEDLHMINSEQDNSTGKLRPSKNFQLLPVMSCPKTR